MTFGPSATTLVGLEAGLEPIPGLLEGLFECIGSEPGAIFNAVFWASTHKDLVEDSGAHFSPSELLKDQVLS
jgi:hypothetical protein